MLSRTQRQTMREMAGKGVELSFLQGQLRAIQGGMSVSIRAYVSGDGKRMLVQADHPLLTWKQLLDHEELHRRLQGDRKYRRAVEDELLRDRGVAPYLAGILERYAKAYASIGVTDENEVAEELLADYRAGFDMLEVGWDSAGNSIRVRRAAARDIRAVEKKTGIRESGVDHSLPGSRWDGKASTETGKKYWRPSLNSSEWDLLNRAMQNGIGSKSNHFDNATKWLYKREKGVSVFAVYGVGDGTEATPLYAAGGRKADQDYKRLQGFLEERTNVEQDRTTLGRVLRDIESQRAGENLIISDRKYGGTDAGALPLFGREPEGARGGDFVEGKRNRKRIGHDKTSRETDMDYLPNRMNEDLAHFVSRLKLSQDAAMPGNDHAESSQKNDTTSGGKTNPLTNPAPDGGALDDPLPEGRQRGKASREPKWVPALSKKEWELANRLIKTYAGEDYNDRARFALKSEKGETVFVIYSTSDDGTMLFAIGGNDAMVANDFVKLWKGRDEYGLNEFAKRLGIDLEELGYPVRSRASGDALSGNRGRAG